MTCRHKLAKEHPDKINPYLVSGCEGCPSDYGYLDDPSYCPSFGPEGDSTCNACWNREIPREEAKELTDSEILNILAGEPTDINKIDDALEYCRLLDSGARRQFESGAVRDIQTGKGRCDLMPLDVVALYIDEGIDTTDDVLHDINEFQQHGREHILFPALYSFAKKRGWDVSTMMLETAKQFEDGAVKYGEDNWQKGIPVKCYIDSAVRHYLKWLRGDKDEPHDRAFCWNILCCIWTCKHKPELNDYAPCKEASTCAI